MRRVLIFGVDNKWWILFALILLVASAAALLHPVQRHPLDRGPRGVVTLLPGLTAEDAAPRQGLIVTSLQSGSESARSGIVVGDRIEALDGHPVKNLGDAIAYLEKDAASTIILHVAHVQATRDVRLRRLGEAFHGP